ncbi:MAG TPA: septal ring lytic transglycosylase RlpA family protein [Bryobacteraceae bacterium]
MRPIHAGAVIFCAMLTVAAGCGKRATAHAPSPVKPAPLGWTETGVASWYGAPYDGRKTSSGEVFDMRAMTAAHRTLPFNTWLEVTNLTNGKQVEVRITDRGPFVDGRIIDLSMGAAERIEMVRAGVVKVKLKVIRPPKDAADGKTSAGVASGDHARGGPQ